MSTSLVIQAGYGTIRVFTSGPIADGASGTHQISYTNDSAPTGSAYQTNTFVENGAAITLGTQNRDDVQQTMTMDYTAGMGSAVVSGPSGRPRMGRSGKRCGCSFT